jgi:predicted acetyltransferase
VDIEIRPVASDEIEAFIRATPFGAGLPMWEPHPAAWWAGPGDRAPFGHPISDSQLARYRADVRELDRTQAAFADGKLVGTSGVLTLEVTIPGKGPVPMGGVTSVGVLPTHRRRGLLRGMMRAMLDDCHERGELLAGLGASEGSIYGRYGFGPATTQVRWELDRTRARLARPAGDEGHLELTDAATALAAWPALLDRVRRTRIGQVSPWKGQWESRASNNSGAKRFLLCYGADGTVDGAAVYQTPWSPDPAYSGVVQVEWLEAATPDAYASLWRFLAGLDLTSRLIAAKRPADEPLRWLLADTRALRVTRMSDDLWIRLIDLQGALGARSYATDGELVLDVTDEFCPWNAGRWLLDGASCTRTTRAPHLATDAATLGSLYLGGTAPGPLAAAGLIDERREGALARLAAMLAVPEAPFNSLSF